MTTTAEPFPNPVRSFAGRRAELDRILAHLDSEVLFFIYGVAGIGKTELTYRLVAEARLRPRWTDALPVRIEVRPGMTAQRMLAQLSAALGSGPVSQRAERGAETHPSEQLVTVARLLDARPYLCVVDDVHHLPLDFVAAGLGYLSRHLARSRLFVASRREIPLPADASPPVVTRLGPLDRQAAEQMMRMLAERIQVAPADPAQMMTATRGSPFHIQRILARRASDFGEVEVPVAELSPTALRVLLAASVAQHRPALETFRRTWAAGAALDEAVRSLEERFLVDLEDGHLVVHDLIRDALLRHVDAEGLAAAHADAAALCLAALHEGDQQSPSWVVDATHHYLAAGRCAEAWTLVQRWHSTLAAAATEHLLLEPLERLRTGLPAERVAIDLLVARWLVRASRFEEAGAVLARIGERKSDVEETRYCVLAGEVAQRAGDFARAEALFARAVDRAPGADSRFSAQLRAAITVVLAGEGARARQLVAAALAALPSPTHRQRARAGWARTVSWMFEERFEHAADEARRTRCELADARVDDLQNQLAMLETLAHLECEDMEKARAAARLIDECGLRRRVAELYVAIVRWADGEARAASAALLAAYEHLSAHGDTINAYLAGYYGSAALAEIGELGHAQALAQRTAELARRAGLAALAAKSLAQQALFAAEALQSSAAHQLADAALATPSIGPRASATVHCAHAHAFTIEGDITRALEHVAHARAAVAAPELAAARGAIDLEAAAVNLVGGNLERAVEDAERVVAQGRGRLRDYEAARARIVLAAAYVARGRRTDLVFAARAVAEARELADLGRLRSIQVGCAILSAALARRENRDLAARDLLAAALRELDPERGSVYAATLSAALDGDAASRAVPGAIALLAHLGFRETVECYLVDQHGRRAATDEDVARERRLRELFVDEMRSLIVARHGEFAVEGRPMLSALLSILVQARGKPVAPDRLYQEAWGVSEYHPLRHRNALYVAVNRLRSCLKKAFPDREVIERASNGWRLAAGVDACVAVAVRQRQMM